jgi:hypothetical protein
MNGMEYGMQSMVYIDFLLFKHSYVMVIHIATEPVARGREAGHVQDLPAGTASTEKEPYDTRTWESIRIYDGRA